MIENKEKQTEKIQESGYGLEETNETESIKTGENNEKEVHLSDLQETQIQSMDGDRSGDSTLTSSEKLDIGETERDETEKTDQETTEKAGLGLYDEKVEESVQEKLAHLLREAGHYMHPGPKEKIGQKEILAILYDKKEMSQKQLTEELHRSPAAVSDILKKLISAGMVRKTSCSKDNRIYNLNLTEKGIEAAKSYKEEGPEKHKGMFDILEQEEQDELSVLLEKLLVNWRDTVFLPIPPKPPIHGPKGVHPVPPKPPVPDDKEKVS